MALASRRALAALPRLRVLEAWAADPDEPGRSGPAAAAEALELLAGPRPAPLRLSLPPPLRRLRDSNPALVVIRHLPVDEPARITEGELAFSEAVEICQKRIGY